MFKIILIAIWVATLSLLPDTAMAIPAFSKKYEAPCTLCHSTWPRLNSTGVKFKLNGYQVPDSEDGGERAKMSPGKDLFLDMGNASPPLSITLDGGMTLIQPAEGPDGAQQDKFFCCVEGNSLTLDIGGSIAPNMAYWVSLPWGKDTVGQGYLRYVNWFGPGLVGMDIGVMKIVDYDAVATGREWFGSPLVAFHGSPYNNNSREIGMTAVHHDTGVRVYGRPNYGNFTYEAGVYTGAHITGAGEDDSELAYTIMGRMDVGGFSASLRYWANTSAQIDQAVTTSTGEALVFPAALDNTDEKTEEFILSARYALPQFEIDVTLDRTSFSIGDRSLTSGDTTHTFSQGAINRTAVSVGAIWLINSWFETGVAYGFTSYDDYDKTVDSVTEPVTGLTASLMQFRMSIKPTMNSRIDLEFQFDLSDSDARKQLDGASFDSQNKLVLQWSLSI